jgi:AraC-like DNA-binding protein
MRVVFDSNQLPHHLSPADKAHAWAEAMERTGVNIEASASRKGFAASLTAVVLDDVQLGKASATTLRVERSRRMLADGDDRIQLLLSDGGGDLYARQRGLEVSWSEGAGVFLDGGVPHVSGAARGGSAISIYLPRRRLGRAHAKILDGICQPLAPTGEAIVLLRRYTSCLIGSDYTDPSLVVLAASHLVDLAILASGAGGPERDQALERGLPAGRLRAVLDTIDKRCREPGLSAADVAAGLGISTRYVQHLLQADGRTFSDELTARRLTLVHARLIAPSSAGRSIADIAFSCGFNDLSTFYRAFRNRFGCTPVEIRDVSRQS